MGDTIEETEIMKLAFDTGGTFTDFAMAGDDGTILLHKVLSTPDDPARAVLQGIDELLARVHAGNGQASAPQILGVNVLRKIAVLGTVLDAYVLMLMGKILVGFDEADRS